MSDAHTEAQSGQGWAADAFEAAELWGPILDYAAAYADDNDSEREAAAKKLNESVAKLKERWSDAAWDACLAAHR